MWPSGLEDDAPHLGAQHICIYLATNRTNTQILLNIVEPQTNRDGCLHPDAPLESLQKVK